MANEELEVLVIDAITGEETTRHFTELEIEANAIDLQKNQEQKALEESKIQARQSALSKLAALGLTEEEIAAL
jgi:DNA-binding NarL/FixJ family response regulator